MKIKHIKKVISNYEHKLSRIDVWAKLRREKYNNKITTLKNKLKETTVDKEINVNVQSGLKI